MQVEIDISRLTHSLKGACLISKIIKTRLTMRNWVNRWIEVGFKHVRLSTFQCPTHFSTQCRYGTDYFASDHTGDDEEGPTRALRLEEREVRWTTARRRGSCRPPPHSLTPPTDVHPHSLTPLTPPLARNTRIRFPRRIS